MKQILLAITLLCLTLLPAGAAEPFAQIPPPKLVECKSAANCDRDPKHLEAFVEGFYKWYATETQIMHSNLHNTITSQQERLAHYKRHIRNLENLVTQKILYWHINSNMEGPYNRTYCAPESDTFTCLQGFDMKWLYNSDTKLKIISGNTAQIHYIINREYELTVYLIVSNKSWKIYKVTAKY